MVRGAGRLPVASGWLLLLVIVPGVVLAAVAYRASAQRDARALDATFRFDASQRVHNIVRKTENYLGGVDALLALYQSSRDVERKEFQAFCSIVFREEKAAVAVGWCPRVMRAGLTRHESQVRAEGLPHYRVLEHDASKTVPVAERAEYFPLAFAYPKSALSLHGVDLLSDPFFREGIEQARDSGRRVATRSFVSRDFPERTRLVAVFSPYYGEAGVPDSVAMRRKHLVGVVVSVIDMVVLLDEGLETPEIRGMDVYVHDVTDAQSPMPIASRLSAYRFLPGDESIAWPPEESRDPSYQTTGDAAGRSWAFYCMPTDRYLADRRGWLPLTSAVACLLIAAAVAWYVTSLRGQTAVVERLVDQRTAELRQANEHLRREVVVRGQAETALQEEHDHLREMLEIQENDRRVIAYEIHDGFVQKSIASLMLLQSLRVQCHDDPESLRKNLDTAAELVAESISEARRLIGGLRPQQLEEQGVAAAMRSLIDDTRRRWDGQIELIQRVRFDRLSPSLETAIFRIVQESLNNAVKHSGSTRVRIELVQPNATVHIEVRDWGQGFDPTRVATDRFGLEGIRERIRIFGGRLSLQSRPGEGTCVRVELPLSAANGRSDAV